MKRLICIFLAVCLLLSVGGCSYDYSDYVPTGGGLADDQSQMPTQPDGNEDKIVTLTFYKEKGHFRLQPENRTMEPIIVDEVALLGIVVASFRQYE